MAVTEHVTPAVRALRVPRPGARRDASCSARCSDRGRPGRARRLRPGLCRPHPAGRSRRRRRCRWPDPVRRSPGAGRRPRSARGGQGHGRLVGRLRRHRHTTRSAARSTTTRWWPAPHAVGRDGTRFAETVTGLRALLEPVSMPPVLTVDRGRLDRRARVVRPRGRPRERSMRASSRREGLRDPAPDRWRPGRHDRRGHGDRAGAAGSGNAAGVGRCVPMRSRSSPATTDADAHARPGHGRPGRRRPRPRQGLEVVEDQGRDHPRLDHVLRERGRLRAARRSRSTCRPRSRRSPRT